MIRNIYLGATEYAAGTRKPLEWRISNHETCKLLRSESLGLNEFACYESDILDLAIQSINKSLESSHLSASQIDAVFIVSNFLDSKNNLETSWISKFDDVTGLGSAIHYYVGITGCGGFHWAARLAASLIASHDCENIVIVSFDSATYPLRRLYDDDKNFTYVTGDAAASCIFSSRIEKMDFVLKGKINTAFDAQQVVNPCQETELKIISKLFKDTYIKAQITANQMDHFIGNNYTLNISRLFCQLANIKFSKAFTENISAYAHCFSSDNLINLSSLLSAKRLLPGNKIMLFSTGPFQWGANIIEKL